MPQSCVDGAAPGSRGNTAVEMAKALHFGAEPTDGRLHGAFGELVSQMNAAGEKKGYQLSVANALWGQHDHNFLQEYTDFVAKNYDAGMNKLDFENETEAARLTINKWVEEKTQDKIKELIKRDRLNPLTCLVLTNAIYFKGDWASKFKKEKTQDLPFTLASDEKVNAPMMSQREKFGYTKGDGFQALEMPYVGDELSMVVFLPHAADGLSEFEKKLTPENLSGWLAKLRKEEIVVHLPRFKMISEFGLEKVFQSLGMKDAFEPGAADFSGMDGMTYFFISGVIHKAFVDVNEEGTEAAAATAVIGEGHMPEEPVLFRADHPFVFLIRDKKAGSILFIGRVMNPKE